jgi:glycosyltransferase involved in cell wall biosynthesis
MKIAFAYDVPYPWHVGGIESMNRNEAEELAKNNEVHFFTTKWKGMKAEFSDNRIHYHAAHETDQSMIYRHGRRSIREALRYKFSLLRMFGYKFDVVVTNAFPIIHMSVIKLYCRMNGSKLIVEVAEVWNRDYWRSYLGPIIGDMAYFLSKWEISGADFYVVISSTTAEKLLKFGVEKSKIKIFAPGLDNNMIETARRDNAKRDKLVVFSGRLIKEKRLDKWLIALHKAIEMDNSIKGLIIGNGPERQAIREQIKKTGMSRNVKLVKPYKSSMELYRTIRRSSALLHMSEREGLGIIAIESIALDTPVILPKYTPIPKEVKDMCIVSDEEDIPSKILEIVNSNDKSQYIRHTKNLDMYSKSKVNSFYGALFRKITGSIR